jgi:hypothetical protein
VENAARPEPVPERPSQPDARSATGASLVPSGPPPGPPHLADPRSLTILTTEHWGLLTARSLVYNESFARAGMFLTFLSASLIALGFVAQSASLVAIPIAILALDLFVGLATLGRLVDCVREEFLAMQAMSRLRHAYLEMAPDLEPYVSTSRYDDFASVATPYGVGREPTLGGLGGIAQGFMTAIGMVAVINAAIAAALAAITALNLGAGDGMSLLAGILVGLVVGGGQFVVMLSALRRDSRLVSVRFPAPATRTVSSP